MSRLARTLLLIVIVVTLLGIGLVVVGIIGFLFPVISIFIVAVADASKRRRDVQATTVPSQGGYAYEAYPPPPPPPPPPKERPWCGSMIEHDIDVCPNCAGRQYQ